MYFFACISSKPLISLSKYVMHMGLLSQKVFVDPFLKLCATHHTCLDLPCNHPSSYLICISAVEGNQTGAWSMKEAPENKCDSVNNRELGTKV